MSENPSCLFIGEVVHQRFTPRRHRLRYRLFQMLVDLDELPRLGERLKLFSHNKFNLFAFYDRDHGDGRSATLTAYIARVLADAGVAHDGGPIRLLCLPRLFGYAFNPLSVYYCFDRRMQLQAMVYEVNNTFGERHSYVIPATGEEGPIRQSCRKSFYVSPFMDMEMTYAFDLSFPGEQISTVVKGANMQGASLIFASFTGARRELSDATLMRTLLSYPLMTLGVVVAIHWEALKLFAKGLRLTRRPKAPANLISVISPATERS